LKISRIIKIALIIIVALILIGLVIWTVISPSPLPVVSQSQLQNGLFGYSKNVASYNISDGSGTYNFKFGLDYSQNLTGGSSTKVAVYCALADKEISSFFTKGVALTLLSSSLSIDGTVDNNLIESSKVQSNLQTYYFGIPAVSTSLGNHNLQVRILVSTIDVNYIGNSAGSYQSVILNGTFTVVS
jgi:hypothetical protein